MSQWCGANAAAMRGQRGGKAACKAANRQGTGQSGCVCGAALSMDGKAMGGKATGVWRKHIYLKQPKKNI